MGARAVAHLSEAEAELQRASWREAQGRRREREKAKESVFGLSLNPELVAASVLARYPDVDSTNQKTCEGALSVIVTEHLVSIVRSSREPALRERELLAALRRKK